MLINEIKIGDLLHYCPVDLKEKYHDIGIIYNIFEKNYEVFWSRSKEYDTYSIKNLERKLFQKIKNKNTMYIIRQNE